MSMEQCLYAKVVMLRRKYLKTNKENKNRNDNTFKFQGHSARSQGWLDLDLYWI